MALTPDDVVTKQFQHVRFKEGFDPDEVDDFLDEIVVEWRKTIAENDLGVAGKDLDGRPFNQIKNYAWSQLGQIGLYEILVREGFEAARQTVLRLVRK